MSWIAWWVVPIVATFVAIAYVTWRGRPRPPETTHEAMEARERFRRAIEGEPPREARHAPTNPAGTAPKRKGSEGGEPDSDSGPDSDRPA